MTDYVVTRKRKRSAYIPQAIDPCLGYYLPSGNAEAAEVPGERSNALGPLAGNQLRIEDTEIFPSPSEREWEAENPEVDAQMERPSSQGSTDAALECPDEWTEFVPSNKFAVVDEKPLQPILTVEEFLKRSSKQGDRPRQTYGRKRKRKLRTKKLDAEGTSQSGNPQASRGNRYLEIGIGEDSNRIQLRSREVPRNPVPSSSIDRGVSSSPVRAPKGTSVLECRRAKVKASKPKRTLKQRIYEAAVSTHGYPDPDFMRSLGDTVSEQTPGPLRFLPGTIEDRPNKRQKRRDGRLVNPRKSMVKHDVEFLSRVRVPGSLLRSYASANECGRTTSSKWAWDNDLDVPLINFLGSRAAQEPQIRIFPNKKQTFKSKDDTCEKGQIGGLTCDPLAFIPMKEAEASYSALFSKERRSATGKNIKRKDVHALRMEPDVTVKRTIADERQVQLTDANIPSQNCEVLSNEQQYERGAIAVAVDPVDPTQVSSVSQAYSAMVFTSPQCSPTSFPVLNEQAASSTVSSIFNRGSGSSLTATDIKARTFSKISDLTSDMRPTDSKIHKPLGSFMHDMIETIRKVHKAEIITEDESSNKQNTHNIKSAGKLHKPSRRPRTTDRRLSTARLMSEQSPIADRVPEDLPIRILSPDISELLQPSNYQIILI